MGGSRGGGVISLHSNCNCRAVKTASRLDLPSGEARLAVEGQPGRHLTRAVVSKDVAAQVGPADAAQQPVQHVSSSASRSPDVSSFR